MADSVTLACYKSQKCQRGKKTATGQRSTRESELRKYVDKEPIVADILEYRELQKFCEDYLNESVG